MLLLPAVINSVPQPFMTEIDEKFDGGVRQSDGGGEFALAGDDEDQGRRDHGGKDPPGECFRNAAPRSFHVFALFSVRAGLAAVGGVNNR